MHFILERDEYARFCKCKRIMDLSCSDGQFLMKVLEHYEKCNFINSQSSKSDECSKSESYTCPECKYSTSCSSSLFDHFNESHALEGCFSCSCGESFDLMAVFLRHYVDCPVAATDLLDPVNQVSSDLHKKNVVIESSSSPENSEQECLSNFESHQHISIDCKQLHKGKLYSCPNCPKGFKSKSLLDQHMHMHFPPRYKCRWCGKMYRWPPVYYHHKKRCKRRPLTHNGITDVPLKDNITLKPDILSTQSISNNHLDLEIKSDSKQCRCLCGDNFQNLPDYLAHASKCSRFMGTTIAYQPTVVKEFVKDSKCPPLPHTPDFASIPESNLFQCNTCGKKFSSRLCLRQHYDGKHRTEGKYTCPFCGKRYRWGASFYYHRKTCSHLKSQ